jgi:hypothetical protein
VRGSLIPSIAGLAIAAALVRPAARSTATRTATTTATTTPASRTTLSTRSSLPATLTRSTLRHSVSAVEVRLLGSLFCSLIVAVLEVLVVLKVLTFDSGCRLRSASASVNIATLRCNLGQTKLRTLFAQYSLARKLDAVALDRQNLHKDLIPLTQLVLHFLHAMLGDL